MFSHKQLALLAINAWGALSAPANCDVVDLGYARYQGIRNETLGIVTYYGLPYAEPPTGSLRWQPPTPIESSSYYRDKPLVNATVIGNQCHQGFPAWIQALATLPPSLGSIAMGTQPQSEDCLHLDVIAPLESSSYGNLPVVVYIHGGGYTIGSSTTSDGSYFTSFASGSIIWVQIQYRLGAYGFLAGDEVKQDGSANVGLLDQRLALEWVQKNIARFGGDPNRVTIWGGSAGGGSVTAQLALYGGESQPPFRAAIAEYPWWQPLHPNDILNAQYNELLSASNCNDIECLRCLSEADLANASQAVYDLGYAAKRYGYGDFYFGPSVDGKIVPALPQDSFKADKFSKVALLTNREGYEGWIFSNFSINQQSQIQPDLQQLWPAANSTFFEQLFDVYPESDFSGSYFSDPIQTELYSVEVPSTSQNSAFYRRQAIFGDAFVDCSSRFIADAVSKSGQPTYKLIFKAGTELHGSTGAFLFPASSSAPDPQLADQLKSYFLAFIISLDPNAASGVTVSKPNWPSYGSTYSSDNQVLLIEADDITTVVDLDAGDRCKFFSRNGHIVRN